MKKFALMITSLVLMTIIFVGCADVDVVLKLSPGSLKAITEKYQAIVSENDGAYKLTVDSQTSLNVSTDYSEGAQDVWFETPLAPFTAAGLDAAKLGEGYKAEGDTFYLIGDYGDGTGEKDNVTDALFESVKDNRSILSYHQDLDHYGIKLPGGKFEWAKDYKANDKDIVFVIAAKPLADIGVDVQNIEGWVFKTMKETDGSDIDVLLKPYDLT
jgi:hypothetical protein